MTPIRFFAAVTLGVTLLLSTPAVAQNDPVVARVNGVEIKLSEVQSAQNNLPEQYRSIPFEQIFPPLVKSLIDTKLAAADARRQGMADDPAFRVEMERAEERMLEQRVVRMMMERQVTDEAIKARYDQIVSQMESQPEVRARHILVQTEDEAKAVIQEALGGEDFAELAKKRSTGPSGPNGGDLGYFGPGRMVPEFEAAAFALNPGDITQTPVKTQFGWHVIKVEDKREQPAPTLPQMEGEIRQLLAQEVGQAYADRLREAAEIEEFNLDGTPAN